MRRLTRAEGKQVLTHFGLAGLFWGLLAACVAVVAVRLTQVPITLTHTVAISVAIGCAIGAVIGWLKRRSPLSVAIVTDIRLNMKQRLSSAWELYERDPQSPLATELAGQLQGMRSLVGQRVFPMSGKASNAGFCYPGVRWGRMVPAAALLLLLVLSLELTPSVTESEIAVDPAVQREGAVLHSYSKSLAQRAESEQLEASAEVAEKMGRLGRRMQGGSLSRDEAVSRLNDLRLAIRDASNAITAQSGSGFTGSAEEQARELIENVARNAINGTPSTSATRNDRALERALVGTDINPEAFRQAMEAAEQGDTEALESLLQQLRERERSALDAEELERAYRRVQSSRENLDDSSGPAEDGLPTFGRGINEDIAFAEEGSGFIESDDGNASTTVFNHAGRRGGRGTARDTSQSELTDSGFDLDHPDIRATGKVKEGQEIAIQTRIKPTVNAVELQAQTLNLQQQRQLEAILASDQLPTHQKDYIKRYFLQLSRAVDSTPDATDPSR
ncbi:MAG: hypothetical protein AAF499_03880 [Pseudomonadota bacterium]